MAREEEKKITVKQLKIFKNKRQAAINSARARTRTQLYVRTLTINQL